MRVRSDRRHQWAALVGWAVALCAAAVIAGAAQAADSAADSTADARHAGAVVTQDGGTMQAAWRIQIREAAVVHGDRVLLGEIARPVGRIDPRQWQPLAALPLWAAPADSKRPMSITRDKLAGALRHYLKDKAALCELPGRIAIQRGGRVVELEELTQRIVKTLTPRLARYGGEVNLREFHVPDYVFLNDATDTLDVEAATEPEPGRVTLRLVTRTLGGEKRRASSASVFADVWKAVPAAARPLNRGEAVTPDTVTHVRKNLAYLRGDIWDGASGGPMRIKSAVGASQVLYKDNLEPMPMVTKGDAVTLVFQGRHVRLTATGQAMTDGRVGEAILVKNMQSQREVYARVRDAATVVVQ